MNLYYFILSLVYFYGEGPPLSKYCILCVICVYGERPPLLQRSVARDLGGVSQIYLYFFRKNFTRQCFGLPQEWSLIMLPLLQWYSYGLNVINFKSFCDVRCTNELIDLWWMNGELWLLYYCLWQTACHVLLLIYG